MLSDGPSFNESCVCAIMELSSGSKVMKSQQKGSGFESPGVLAGVCLLVLCLRRFF